MIKFLNTDLNAPVSTWEDLFYSRERKPGLSKKAKRLQAVLRRDIEAILQRQTREAGLDRLARKVERIEFAHARLVERWPPYIMVDVGASVLNFRDGEKFVWQQSVGGQALELWLYRYLDMALWTGEFTQLRICRQCSKFFTSYRRDAQACGPECNQEYHNSKGQKSGYFRRNYKQKKRKKLNEARRLLRKKKMTLDEIMEKTRLTKLALIREGILEPR